MASLNLPAAASQTKGSNRKAVPSVDLTAMVDLAFLLITFFMLTTSLSKNRAMDIVKPVPIDEPQKLHDWPASRTMTILLGANNKAMCYLGEAIPANMKVCDLKKIGSQISAHKAIVSETHSVAEAKNMLVIIKPTDHANYKNFVDVLDEVSIANIGTYAVDDKYILQEELSFLKQNRL